MSKIPRYCVAEQNGSYWVMESKLKDSGVVVFCHIPHAQGPLQHPASGFWDARKAAEFKRALDAAWRLGWVDNEPS